MFAKFAGKKYGKEKAVMTGSIGARKQPLLLKNLNITD
jgi:hypothetical protein